MSVVDHVKILLLFLESNLQCLEYEYGHPNAPCSQWECFAPVVGFRRSFWKKRIILLDSKPASILYGFSTSSDGRMVIFLKTDQDSEAIVLVCYSRYCQDPALCCERFDPSTDILGVKKSSMFDPNADITARNGPTLWYKMQTWRPVGSDVWSTCRHLWGSSCSGKKNMTLHLGLSCIDIMLLLYQKWACA